MWIRQQEIRNGMKVAHHENEVTAVFAIKLIKPKTPSVDVAAAYDPGTQSFMVQFTKNDVAQHITYGKRALSNLVEDTNTFLEKHILPTYNSIQ